MDKNLMSQIFDKRPHVSETCPRCRGRGSITRHYSLVLNDGPIPGAPENAIPAFVVGACDIFDTTREAAEIATRYRIPVAFDFNEIVVVVKPDDDPVAVARAWWMRKHKETPEQTAARR